MRRAGERVGDLLEVALGPGDEGDLRSGRREAVGEQLAEPTAGAGDHHPPAVDVARLRKRVRYLDPFGHRHSFHERTMHDFMTWTDQYNTRACVR